MGLSANWAEPLTGEPELGFIKTGVRSQDVVRADTVPSMLRVGERRVPGVQKGLMS